MADYSMEKVARAICKERRYAFIEGSGQGAFKETFAAATSSGDLVALKVLKPGCSSERTDREIAAMKKCSHPNIVALLELATVSYEGQAYTYIVEEFLSGGSLADRLKEGPLNRAEMLAVGTSLMKALIHTSGHDLVHRDYKPPNIMFKTLESEAQLSDFGIVRDLGQDSLTKSYLMTGPGSPFYAAPEQLNNEKAQISWRTDQFSLGVTLALAHFGVHPYQAEQELNAQQVVSSVMARSGPSEYFKSLTVVNQLPILLRMVSPWPVQRVRIASELLDLWTKQEGSI